MTKQGKQRLRQLIEFIRELPDDKFDFSTLVSKLDENECGTVCCAAGWLPAAFPEDWKYVAPQHRGQGVAKPALKHEEDYRDIESSLALYFAVSEEDIDRLFFYGHGYLEEEATREEWIENAEEYLLEQNA